MQVFMSETQREEDTETLQFTFFIYSQMFILGVKTKSLIQFNFKCNEHAEEYAEDHDQKAKQ